MSPKELFRKNNTSEHPWMLIAQDHSHVDAPVKAWIFQSRKKMEEFNESLSDAWKDRNAMLIDEIVDMRLCT